MHAVGYADLRPFDLADRAHAGGKFPRPDLHERLGRVLAKTRPDLIIACYGMNDGIYLPPDAGRMQKFKDGLARLGAEAAKANAKIIYLTPAVFDPQPIKGRLTAADKADSNHPFEGYGDVLDGYSDWLLGQRDVGWKVIDLHGPMRKSLGERRLREPTFTYARDGVHPSQEGQFLMGAALSRGLGVAVDEDIKNPASKANKLFKLIDQRSQTLRDAWLTETGHKRPLGAGLPLDQARVRAAELTAAIERLLK
ncbi:MAG: GDSL-type esterase/lipase family protein [Planctomycetota bacterium]